jgi:hypothetical protein
MITSKPKLKEDLSRQVPHPLHDNADLDALLDAIGNARFVLMDEANHYVGLFFLACEIQSPADTGKVILPSLGKEQARIQR